MSLNFLDFEQPIAELEAKIDSLTAVSRQDEKLDINIDEDGHKKKPPSGGSFLIIKTAWTSQQLLLQSQSQLSRCLHPLRSG